MGIEKYKDFLQTCAKVHESAKTLQKGGVIDVNAPTLNGNVVLLSEHAFREIFDEFKVGDCGGTHDYLIADFEGTRFVSLVEF